MSSNRVILLSCGSYNPPTNMHLRMFEIARDYLHRMGKHVVVGGVISPAHDNYGKKELVNAEHRCTMLKFASENSEWINVSTWESYQNNWTPTKLVLQHHQNLLNTVLLDSTDAKNHDLEWIPENVRNSNDRTPIQIKLLCGADLLESFGVPGLWLEEDIDAIIGQHGLVVITREGCNPNKFIYDSDLLSRHMHNICIVTEWICNEVSSTKIRRALKRGESVRYLIQDSVIDYIQCHGLYNTKTSTKLALPSTNNSNNYLHIDSKYQSTFLTPSPSDINMATPSLVEIISIDIAESVIKKNSINLPKSTITTPTSLPLTTTTTRTIDNIDYIMREKFMNVIAETANKLSTTTSKSFYPGQAKQVIATETGESKIFREVGPQNLSTNSQDTCIDDIEENLDTIDDSNTSLKFEIENNTTEQIIKVDGNVLSSVSSSETIKADRSVIENNETSQEDDDSLGSIVIGENNNKNISLNSNPQKNTEANEEKFSSPLSTSEITEESTNKSSSKRSYNDLGPTQKSLLNSKSLQDDIDGKYRKSMVNSRRSPKRENNLTEQVVPKMKNDKKSKKQKNIKKETKNVNSISYKSESTHKNYLGSLESINTKQLTALSKKSTSFEFIKCDFSLKEIDMNADIETPNSSQKSSCSKNVTPNKSEVLIQDNETINELSTVCCYDKNASSSKNLYTVHSNNSSPLELDSTECDLCSSYNLQNSETIPGEPQCELCEICGDIAMDIDVVASSRPEADELINTHIFAGSRDLLSNTVKQKIVSGRLQLEQKMFDDYVCGDDIEDERQQPAQHDECLPSTSIEEYSVDDSTLDDVEFEIENCGLEMEAATQSSANTSYIATTDAIKKISIKELRTIDEDTVSKLMIRGNSLITRGPSRPDSKRRYSSVDNIPSTKQKITTIANVNLVAKNQSKIAMSVDNIRASGVKKNPNKLNKSADDVAKAGEDVSKDQDDAEKNMISEQSDEHRVGGDTVKFVIDKHGLKIISDKETSL